MEDEKKYFNDIVEGAMTTSRDQLKSVKLWFPKSKRDIEKTLELMRPLSKLETISLRNFYYSKQALVELTSFIEKNKLTLKNISLVMYDEQEVDKSTGPMHKRTVTALL